MINLKRNLSALSCFLTIILCSCVKVPEHCGDGYDLNPKTEFCFENKTYKKCGGNEYNPDKEFCSGNIALNLCGGNEYNPSIQICNGDKIEIKPPELYTYTITLTANPAGSGTFSREPDNTSYISGTQVEITATAASSYAFKNWTGTLTSSDNPITVTMDANKSLVAVFERQQQTGTYTLTTNVTPANSGNVTRSPDRTGYASGESVTVTATAASGYNFKNWTGASSAATNPVTITMNGNKTLTAVFEVQQQTTTYTLTTGVTPANGGSVSRDKEKENYASGESVTITATPERCYAFNSWTGSLLAPTNPLKVTMDGNKTLIASFNKVCDGGTPGEPLMFGGQTYRTVIIGGKRWMAENLNYDMANNVGSWCYEYSQDSCAKYGRLYNWNTAMSVCPVGWHLPSNDEWDNLVTVVGGNDVAGKRLKSTSWWENLNSYTSGNGTDDFGFSALPSGQGSSTSNGGFCCVSIFGNWWTATDYVHSRDAAYKEEMGYNSNRVGSSNAYKNGIYSTGYSVRCVEDD